MGGGRVTVEDVARHAGVSTATVSRALNGSPRVTDETLARVMRSVEELGFRPTPAARNLRQRRTRSIALVVPSIANPFFPELVAGVHAEIHARGYSLLLTETDDTEREATRVVESRIADGVLLVGNASSVRSEAGLRQSDLPIVAFDRAPKNLTTTVVQSENELGAAEVVAHLAALGRRRVAHIAGPGGFGVSEDRAQGYHGSVTAFGLDDDLDLVTDGDFTEDSGYRAAVGLIERAVEFDAIFAANDMMAIGAMAGLKDHGIRVPTDVAVAGYDGIHLARYVDPPLTTYAQPITAIARRAVELLFEAVESGDRRTLLAADGGQRTLRFAGELVIRSSTQPTAGVSA